MTLVLKAKLRPNSPEKNLKGTLRREVSDGSENGV